MDKDLRHFYVLISGGPGSGPQKGGGKKARSPEDRDKRRLSDTFRSITKESKKKPEKKLPKDAQHLKRYRAIINREGKSGLSTKEREHYDKLRKK